MTIICRALLVQPTYFSFIYLMHVRLLPFPMPCLTNRSLDQNFAQRSISFSHFNFLSDFLALPLSSSFISTIKQNSTMTTARRESDVDDTAVCNLERILSGKSLAAHASIAAQAVGISSNTPQLLEAAPQEFSTPVPTPKRKNAFNGHADRRLVETAPRLSDAAHSVSLNGLDGAYSTQSICEYLRYSRTHRGTALW